MIVRSKGNVLLKPVSILKPKKAKRLIPVAASGRAGGPSGSALELPALASIVHMCDFSDASVIFSDTGGTTPITDGTAIARVNEKGSDSTNYYVEATVGERPTWRESRGQAQFTHFTHGIALNADPADTVNGGWTVAYLGLERDNLTAGFEYAATYSGFTTQSLLTNANGVILSEMRVYVSGSFVNPASLPSVDEKFSAILTNNSVGPAQDTYYSWGAADQSMANSFFELLNTGQIGYNGVITSGGWGGYIGAHIIWDKLLDADERQQVRDYDTATWGTVYA